MSKALSVGLAATMGLGAASLVHAAMPSLKDVRSSPQGGDAATARGVQLAAVAVAAAVVITGVAAWKMADTPAPLVVGGLVAGITIGVYEVALEAPPHEGGWFL